MNPVSISYDSDDFGFTRFICELHFGKDVDSETARKILMHEIG